MSFSLGQFPGVRIKQVSVERGSTVCEKGPETAQVTVHAFLYDVFHFCWLWRDWELIRHFVVTFSRGGKFSSKANTTMVRPSKCFDLSCAFEKRLIFRISKCFRWLMLSFSYRKTEQKNDRA